MTDSEFRIQAGTARSNITPPLGICMAGGFNLVRPRDVWNELYANALVLDDGLQQVAIVSVDVCAIDTPSYQDICAQIADLTGIPPQNVILTATHTHSGPATGDNLDGIYEIDPDYDRLFRRKVASAVRLAQQRKRPVTLSIGRSEHRAFLFNRRLRKPDGSIVMNWVDLQWLTDAAAVHPTDPEVLVLRLDDTAAHPLALVVNWANHNNAAPFDVISADYAGVMADTLRAIYGREVGVLFLPGAAGDVNSWDHCRQDTDPKRYQRVGRSLAGAVLQAQGSLTRLHVEQIGIAQRTLTIPERPYCPYDITIDGTFGPPEEANDFWDAYRNAYERHKDQPLLTHEVNLTVLTLSDQMALCTCPAELFTEYGLAIKAQSGYPYTMVAELTNGLVGYVPTPEAFDEGGYEVRKMPGNSVLEIQAGEHIIRTWLELLNLARPCKGF